MSTPDLGTKQVLAEANKLAAQAILELYTLDATAIGGDIFYFHPGTNNQYLPIIFQDITYLPMPLEAKGFEMKSRGELPRPTISFANLRNVFTSLALGFNDLVGAKIIRRRTFANQITIAGAPSAPLTSPAFGGGGFGDSPLGGGGTSEAVTPPNVQFPIETFYINQKLSETKLMIQFELVTRFELDGYQLPRRQVVSNLCVAKYRGGDLCPFASPIVVADQNGNPLGTGGQTYRGLWNPLTVYVVNDVVYLLSYNIQRFYICIGASVSGSDQKPPNTKFWKWDECSRKINNGCKLRFDPNNLNLPLPFGSFPGAGQIPGSA